MATLIHGTAGAESTPGGRTDGGTDGDAPADSSAPATHDKLLTSLSARQRIAYLMCERSGLSDRAIAAHLHIGVGDARRLVEEARLAVRRLRLAATEGRETR